MNKPPSEMTQLECAQLLRDFIDARIEVFMCRRENASDATWARADNASTKLFAQIAGTGEGE